MKRIFLFIIPFLVSVSCYSQAWVYHPFPTSNALWREYNEYYIGHGASDQEDFQQFIAGDTLVSGKTYHKIYRTGNSNHLCGGPTCFPPAYTTYFQNKYVGCIREDSTRRIFICFPSMSENVLYDFSLIIGDTIKNIIGIPTTCYASPPWKIMSIDSVIVGGTYRKRFYLGNPPLNYGEYVIEGIGDVRGLFSLQNLTPYCEPRATSSSQLLCFMQNNITVYPDGQNCDLAVISGIAESLLQKSIIVYPNPSNGQFTFNGIDKKNKIEIYDGIGHLIYQTLSTDQNQLIDLSNKAAGIYFYKISTKEKIIGQGKIQVE